MNMEQRKVRIRASLWRTRFIILAFAVVAALASVISAIDDLAPATTTITVASSSLPAGHILTESNLREAKVPAVLVPKDATRVEPGDVLSVPASEGFPLTRQMVVSDEFLDLAPPGSVILPVTIDSAGLGTLLSPGKTVALYAPADDFSESHEAVEVVSNATIVGIGTNPEELNYSTISGSGNKAQIFVAVARNATTVVLGYGSSTTMRVVVVR